MYLCVNSIGEEREIFSPQSIHSDLFGKCTSWKSNGGGQGIGEVRYRGVISVFRGGFLVCTVKHQKRPPGFCPCLPPSSIDLPGLVCVRCLLACASLCLASFACLLACLACLWSDRTFANTGIGAPTYLLKCAVTFLLPSEMEDGVGKRRPTTLLEERRFFSPRVKRSKLERLENGVEMEQEKRLR